MQDTTINGVTGLMPAFRVVKSDGKSACGMWCAMFGDTVEWVGDTRKFDTRDELVAALVAVGCFVHPGGGIYSA